MALSLSLPAFADPAPTAAPPTPPRDADPRELAIDQVLASARSADPFLRANALEAAQRLPERILPLAQLALDDPHPAVRFAALASIGRLRLKALAPAAERKLADESESVRAAAMFALRRCGRDIDISPMAGMLSGPDPGVRGNAALLLGMLGDASAAPMLKDMAHAPLRGMQVTPEQAAIARMQVAEAVVKLGDQSLLDPIRAGAYSQFDEVRVLAVQMMGRLGDRRMAGAMRDMLQRPPIELQLAAAEALGRLGNSQGLSTALDAADARLPTARAQAAMVLGLFESDRARTALTRLLADSDEQVRLAAAAALLGPGTEKAPEPRTAAKPGR